MTRPVDVSVVTSGHDVADARLHRLVAALLRRGLRVEVLGLGSADDAPPGAAARARPRPGPAGRGVLAVRYALAARGRVLLTLDPDSLVAARVVGGLRRRRVVADVHEDYRRLVQDRDWSVGVVGVAGGLVVRAADRFAATAALTIVSDDHVPPRTARRRLVVRNEADLHLVGAPAEPSPQPRACYVGDVRRSRGIFTMLDAVAAAPGWTLDVVGPVRDADRDAVAARCAAPDLDGRVRWHGRRTPAAAWEAVDGAWAGFALLEDTPAFRDALPSKVYEYLAKGIVPVVSDLPRQRDLLERVGAGAVVPDAAAAAQVLRSYAADPDAWRREREAVLAWSRTREDAGSAYDCAASAVEEVVRGG